MYTPTYKSRVPSPFQVKRTSYAVPKPEKKDTLRDEMKKLIGVYEFTASIEEDLQTTSTLSQVPNLCAFICTLKMGDKILAQGRGATAINQINKFIVRNITFAFHGALVDAVVRSTKIQDSFRPDATPHPWSEANSASPSSYSADAPDTSIATPKQVEYLRQLISVNMDEGERENMEAQLSEMTKQEASKMIESFRR